MSAISGIADAMKTVLRDPSQPVRHVGFLCFAHDPSVDALSQKATLADPWLI